MMLAPVSSIASTVLGDPGEDEFGGKPPLGEMRSNSLLRPFRWNFRVEKYQYRRASSAKCRAEDAGISREFLNGGK